MTLSYLLQLVVQQTWQVALLAALVWLLTRFAIPKRAHLSHMLWALVLIKCITPPIWSSSVGFFSRISGQFSIGLAGRLETKSSSQKNQKGEWSEAAITLGSDLIRSDLPTPILGKAVATNAFASSLVAWLAATLWISGVCLMTLLSLIRGTMFIRLVQRTNCGTPPEVSQCVERLNQRLGLRRRVGVVVVSSSLGPAVFGLIRPVILLPKAIVEGRNAAQLEPLIAHEMIHIRRGDLWLALIQTIACNVGWFHPLVWLASRQLTIESERCCDEETIASLPCKPSVYARSLLEVLELKHQLRAAPALPGVRPVDITLSRLDRIMRLGQGSRSRSPWWVWGIALVSSFVVLPGGCYVAAQTPESKQSAKQESKGDSTPIPPTNVPSTLRFSDDNIDNNKDDIIVNAQVIEIAANLPEALRLQEWMNEPASADEVKFLAADIKIQGIVSSTPTNLSPAPILVGFVKRFLNSPQYQEAKDPQSNFTYYVARGYSLKFPNRLRIASLSPEEHASFFETVVEPCQPHLVVSRPSLVVHSGQQASISVDKNGHHDADTNEGYTLQIKPTLLGENKIRLEFDMAKTRASHLAVGTETRSIGALIECQMSDTIVVALRMGEADAPYDLAILDCSLFKK